MISTPRARDALGDDLAADMGTSLDKGVELDALAKLPKDERKGLIDRAKAGPAVICGVTNQGFCAIACRMKEHMLRFQFDEKKGVEALTYIASKWPGVTAFFAAKVLFFAEKQHLNRYSRPIVGDTFIAMPNGPVPSTIYDFIKGRLDQAGDPEAIMAALLIDRDPYPRVTAKREPDADSLSLSDTECLDEAIAFCRARGFGTLSSLTHQERAWLEAPANGPMDYEAMIEGKDREAVLAEAREFAAYGVL